MRAPVTAAVCAALLLCPVLLYQNEDGYQPEDLSHEDPVDITPEYTPCPTSKVLRSREACRVDGVEFQCIKFRCCDGYTYVSGRCLPETVDPCSLLSCEQKCMVKGSAVWCSCYDGFKFSKDNYHAKTQPYCVDVDECQDNNGGCSEKCINDPGSYHCECSPPRILGRDGRRCVRDSQNDIATVKPLPLLRASSRCYATCDVVAWLTKKVKNLNEQLHTAQAAIRKLMETSTASDGAKGFTSSYASAYQVLDAAVPLKGGYCRCERGPRGPAGPRGMDGPPGPRGPRGRQGPKSSLDLVLLMIADLRHDISQLESRVYKDGEQPVRFNLLNTWASHSLKLREQRNEPTTTPVNKEAYTYPANEESFNISELVQDSTINWPFERDDPSGRDNTTDLALLQKIKQYYILSNMSTEWEDDEESDDDSDYSFDEV